MGRLSGIQYLRAIAAMAVVVFHVSERIGAPFMAGAAGVDIFFVVSGFIMWVTTAERASTPRSFAANRAIRIIPLYWAVTLGYVALATVAPWSFPNLLLSSGHVASSLLFIPHRDPSGVPLPVVQAGWTLEFEVLFYALFAIALAAPHPARLGALSATLCALPAIGLLTPAGGPVWIVLTSPLLLEFLGGVWLGHGFLWAKRDGIRPPWRLGAAIVAGAVPILLLVTSWMGPFTDAARVLAWGVPAVLITGGVLAIELAGRMPASRTALRLGDASYAIYLTHGVVIAAVLRLGGQVGLPDMVLVPGAVAASALAGVVTHQVFELPVTRALKRSLRSSQSRRSCSRPL
ncbi:MAG: acyltransferase [Gemmatimonadaceae bacterium]|nr:acyltransferase [Acetobacteraceae bacterium]